MTWVDYVEDVEAAIREQIKVGYVTMAVSGTDGLMGAPVEQRTVDGLGVFRCRVRHTEEAFLPLLIVERDRNGCTVWRADMVDNAYRNGHGCGDYWDCVYEITEG